MANYFPRQTVVWKVQETPAFRRLTLSLVEMALVTGVLLRVYRALAYARAPQGSWLYLGGAIALGTLFLCAMATLHLGNYPVRHWVWRAPAFAALEAVAEALTSLVLVAVRRERIGTGVASYGDWPMLASQTLLFRILAVGLFALVLAGVVQVVRYTLLRREHRAHTAAAIHHAEAVRRTGEHRPR